MTQSTVNTKPILWVAIDMAKYQQQILIEYPNHTRKVIKLKNTQAEYQRLLKVIQQPDMETIVGFEATADYHRCLAYFLQANGMTCRLIASLATARTREAMYNSWDKHDPKDAQVILHLLKTGLSQYYYDPLYHNMNDIQELSNTYHQVSKRKTRLQHSLKNHYFTLYFPEAEKYMHSTRAQWFLNLLLLFPCPAAIRAVTQLQFIEQASILPGKKVNKKVWLQDFYQIAYQSIGIPVEANSEAMHMFCKVLKEYQQLCLLRDEIEQRAIILLQQNSDFQRLQTVPGIGPIIALTILAEGGDLRRFKHYRQFLKFCGFDLCRQQSGTLRGQAKLSKRGNARLRQALWVAAQVAVIQKENTFRRKFNAYVKKEPGNADVKRKAYTVVAVKMARVIHALIKQQIHYQGYFESH